MKYSEATKDQRAAQLEHIDRRWRQLNELETKRGDAAINYLFLVSGGAAAATLAFIGNSMKDGNPPPSGAIWMLGCFATALLLVGLMKARLGYHVASIFSNWRNEVKEYYEDKKDWADVLDSDEREVNKNAALARRLGWASYVFLVVGVIIGFVKLQEDPSNVRKEKNANVAISPSQANFQTTREVDISGHGEGRVQRPGESINDDRNVTSSAASTATAEKEVVANNSSKQRKP
jgi:hypothetical protein